MDNGEQTKSNEGGEPPKPRTRVRPGASLEPKEPEKAKKVYQRYPPTTPTTTAAGKHREHKGRPDLRNDENILNVLEQALLAGNTQDNAAILSGISSASFHRWMAEGASAPEGTLAREVWVRMKKAQATCIHRNVAIIQKAAAKTWTASAWFLERRCPDDWGRKDRVAIGGDASGIPVLTAAVSERVLTDEEALASLGAVLERAKARRAES